MKPITITQSDKDQMRADFEKALETLRLTDGSFTFTRSFTAKEPKPEDRPMICYTPDAYLKMQLLVSHFDSEVGWHGLVKRLEENVWLVYDVLVYDQIVTGATVNTDQEGYVEFLKNLTDEQANNMFFHGHSHVNMGVFASTVDMEHRKGLVEAAEPDGFWIFQIWNKKNEISTALYDLKNNLLYDTKDIDLCILFEDGSTNLSFNADADKHVRKVFTAPADQKKVTPFPTNNAPKKGKKGYYYGDADNYPYTGNYYEDGYYGGGGWVE